MTVSKTSSAAAPAKIYMPTEKQLTAAYKSIIDAAQKSGKLTHLSKPPANASKYPSYNISEGLGVGRFATVIKGELYLKTQVVAPNTKPQWYKAGPAPLF